MDKFKNYCKSFGHLEKVLIIIWLCLCLMITIISFVGFPEGTDTGSITVFRISFYFLFTIFILVPAITIRNARYAKISSTSFSIKSWPKTLTLAIFLGVVGGHRFYVKKYGSAIFYILTCGGFLVCWMTDIALILLGIFTDKNGDIVTRRNNGQIFVKNEKPDDKSYELQKSNVETSDSFSKIINNNVSGSDIFSNEETPTESGLYDFLSLELNKRNIEYLDQRKCGRYLWVFDCQSAREFVENMKQYGINLYLRQNGGQATAGRSAWWTRRIIYGTPTIIESDSKKNISDIESISAIKESSVSRFSEPNSNVKTDNKIQDFLAEELNKRNIEYLDERYRGRYLWIFDCPEAQLFVKEMQQYGINLYLRVNGGQATEGRSAWWTRRIINSPPELISSVCTEAVQPSNKSVSAQLNLFTDIEMSGKSESRQSIPDHISFCSVPDKSNSTEADVSSTAETIYGSTDFSDFDLDSSSYEGRLFSDMKKYADKNGHKATFVPFMQYWPRYSDMNRLQKAWYFFWRSEVRAGRYPNTDLSYICLYIYELLSGVGWEQPSDGYQKLLEIWLNYRDSFPKLDSYLAGWSYDFTYKYKLEYKLPDALSDIVPDQLAVIDILIDRHSNDKPLRLNFKMAAALSDYNIYGSRFYNDGHQMLMAEVIPRVISLADAHLLKTKNKGILALYGPNRTRKQSYRAFSSALCPGSNELIHVDVKAYTSSSRLRKYVTGLIKFSENSLRKHYKYRGRVQNVEIDSETAALIESFIRTDYSPKSASGHSDLGACKHPGLTLDHEAIRKLREESDEVREALKVDTDLLNSDEIVDTLNNTEYDGAAVQENEEDKSESCRFFKSEAMPENLKDLFSKFTAVQQKIIYLIICSDNPATEIENLANEEMSMPDILIDEINDEASEALDDILIDTMGDKPCILDEYYNDIRNAVITEEAV